MYQHEASRSTSLYMQYPLALTDAQVDLALAEIEKGFSLLSTEREAEHTDKRSGPEPRLH